MGRQHATRLEVSAQRFHVRRMTHALVRRDIAMHDDPLRAQSMSLLTGCLLTVIAVTLCGVLALIAPRGVPDAAPIVMSRESGALYVRIGDTLHPVPNLASARLVARAATNPAVVSDAAIAEAKRGPVVGIPGAPSVIGGSVGVQPWTVCDDQRTVIVVGDAALGGFDSSEAVLVNPRGEGAALTYLLYEGRRARVDLRNLAVVRALRLEGITPLAVSRTLLDAVPEAPPIVAPRIAGAGGDGPTALRGNPIGSVVGVVRADATQHYVVLADGVQPVGEVAADLIRFTYATAGEAIPTVSPAAIAAAPAATTLPVGTFPRRAGLPVGAEHRVAICAVWHSNPTNTIVMTGDSTPTTRSDGVTLAQADGEGPNVDAVTVAAGRSAYVRSAPIANDDGASGPRFLVTDSGVAYGIRDDDTARLLGVTEQPAAAPWPLLARLPRGPELSIDAASVVRDGLATPS